MSNSNNWREKTDPLESSITNPNPTTQLEESPTLLDTVADSPITLGSMVNSRDLLNSLNQSNNLSHNPYLNNNNFQTEVANFSAPDSEPVEDENERKIFLENLKNEGFQLTIEKTTRIIQPVDQNETSSANNNKISEISANFDKDREIESCELFIGKVPKEVTEIHLWPLLKKYGKITEFRIMMDYQNYNRGFAFVTFSEKKDANNAMKDLNNYQIREGKFLGVCRSVDNRRLFVGGLLKSKNKDEILTEMKRMSEGVVKVIAYSSVMDKTKNRGFAFVEYETHRKAARARKQLIDKKPSLWGRSIAVDWAEPEIDIDDEIMSKVKNLYVRNLMHETTEATLEQHFSKIVPAVNIERIKKIKDYAFLHFDSRENAEKCKTALHGTIIDGSVIDIHWAKPVDKDSYAAYLNKKNSDKQAKEAAKQVNNFYHRPILNGVTGPFIGTQFNPTFGINSPFNAVQFTNFAQPAPAVQATGVAGNAASSAVAATPQPNYVTTTTTPMVPTGTALIQVPVQYNGVTAMTDCMTYEINGQRIIQPIQNFIAPISANQLAPSNQIIASDAATTAVASVAPASLDKDKKEPKRPAGGTRAQGSRSYLGRPGKDDSVKPVIKALPKPFVPASKTLVGEVSETSSSQTQNLATFTDSTLTGNNYFYDANLMSQQWQYGVNMVNSMTLSNEGGENE